MEDTCLPTPGMARRLVSSPVDVQVNTAACISVEHTGWGKQVSCVFRKGQEIHIPKMVLLID